MSKRETATQTNRTTCGIPTNTHGPCSRPVVPTLGVCHYHLGQEGRGE